MLQEILEDAKNSMDKSLTALENNFKKIRTGRANTSLLDAIKVGGVKIPIDVTKREFRNYFMLQVPSCFSRLRGNSQTLCQKNWRGKITGLRSVNVITIK